MDFSGETNNKDCTMNSLPMLVSLIETAIKEKTIDKMYGNFLEEAVKMGLSSYTLNVLIFNAKKRIENGNTDSNDDVIIPFIYRPDIIKPKPEIKYVYKTQEKIIIRKEKGYVFFIILFAIAAIVLGILYVEADDKYSRANYERNEYRNRYEDVAKKYDELQKDGSYLTSSLRSEISSLKQERDNAKSQLSNLESKVSNTYPLIITDIEIANVTENSDIHTNYGNSLYGSSTMFLQPQIKYIGLSPGNKTIKVKWYNPDGSIRRGSKSPPDFSQSQSMYVSLGDNNTYTLVGWGNSSKGHWRSGTYRIEIWYEDTCLKSKTFTIY